MIVLFVVSGCSKSQNVADIVGESNYHLATKQVAFQKSSEKIELESNRSVSVTNSSQLAKLDGLMFTCTLTQRNQLQIDMQDYFRELGIDPAMIRETEPEVGKVFYSLSTPESETETLSLKKQKKYFIHDEVIALPNINGKFQYVKTVSRKEILLSLLQHGRLTEFRGNACSISALRDHVGVRQNIVAWAEKLNWQWPNGDSAFWNNKFWNKGTPLPSVSLDKALLDAFINQKQYGIGCFTATKLSYAQGILDYFVRIKKDSVKAALVRERLLQDQDPLVGVAPPSMWSFERDFDPSELNMPGKILSIKRGIAIGNFVPGDWIYLLNTDAMSYEKPGYEGSNAIYLGRGIFDDYYNDNNHHYTYKEKLDEVYQWRNGVFSRSRDFKKIKPLNVEDYYRLSKSPNAGGLLEDFRVSPYLFGYEELPKLLIH